MRYIVITVFALAAAAQPPVSPPSETVQPGYTLSVNDQILIRVPESEEINEKSFRIDSEGYIYLPLVGKLRAAGMSVAEFEEELARALRKYFRAPQVSVSIVQVHGDPIFVFGAVRGPGVYPLREGQTLVELLTRIGGLQPTASRRIKVTRQLKWGRIPLPTATEDPGRNVSVVEISLNRLSEAINPAEDIVLKPHDVIRVATEELIYLSGEASKTGGFPLGERDSLSVLQLIAMAGGLGPNSAPEKAKTLRPVLDTSRRAEIPVNVRKILDGQAMDLTLLPNDVLVIPRSRSFKTLFGRAGLVMLPTALASLTYVLVR